MKLLQSRLVLSILEMGFALITILFPAENFFEHVLNGFKLFCVQNGLNWNILHTLVFQSSWGQNIIFKSFFLWNI